MQAFVIDEFGGAGQPAYQQLQGGDQPSGPLFCEMWTSELMQPCQEAGKPKDGPGEVQPQLAQLDQQVAPQEQQPTEMMQGQPAMGGNFSM